MRDRTYVKTHYRVECGYVWGKGIEENALASFQDEVKTLLGELGFVVLREAGQDMLGSSLEMVRGKERLYCHPMDLSGPVLVDHIETIKTQLSRARCFRIRMVDTYETGIDYAPEELDQILVRELPVLRQMIYTSLSTARTNRFFNDLQVHDQLFLSCGVAERFSREVIQVFHDECKSRRIAATTDADDEKIRQINATVNLVLQEMIGQGYIICMEQDGKKFYRSRNKGELRKLRLAVRASPAVSRHGWLAVMSP